MERERLERLHARAQERFLRRKGYTEAIWTRHIQKTGHQPTVWHSTYERAYALENEAEILVNWLSRLRDHS